MARRRKSGKNKTIILTCILAIAIFMSTGYSLLSQKLKLEGEANLYASKKYLWYQITNNYSSQNGGYFYENQFENKKYSYIGNNNSNYISLDGELWRIVSVESDHTTKVVKTNDTLAKVFDELNNRTSSSTYCTNLSLGCNSWASNDSLVSGNISGNVQNNSTLLTYLNETFYNSLSQDLRGKITTHDFNVGPVSSSSTFSEAIIEEQEYIWNGNIGLLSLTEVLYPNNNINITLGQSQSNNYLLDSATGKSFWTITPLKDDSSKVWAVSFDKTQVGKDAYLQSETLSDTTYNIIAYPTMYLKDTVKYSSGDGTINNPFILE